LPIPPSFPSITCIEGGSYIAFLIFSTVDHYDVVRHFAMPGDINNDGIVDYMDIGTVCRLFGKTPQDPTWNPNCDIDNDNFIDYKDIGIPCRLFGKTDP